LGFAAQAQFGYTPKPVNLTALKAQPLLVQLDEPDPKELKELAKKPDDLREYQAYVAYCNTQLQQLVPKLWTLSSAVEFKTLTELNALRAAKGAPLTVLRHTAYRATLSVGGVNNRFGPALSSERITAMQLSQFNGKKEEELVTAPIATTAIRPSDIVFAVRYLQNELQAQAAGKSRQDLLASYAEYGKRLRTKILLLNEADVKDKLTEKDIKQAYPFPYQLVPRSTIEAAVLAADPRYAYVQLTLVGPGITAQTAVDAADGEILGISASMQGVGKGVPTSDAIGKSNLKDFAKAASGK
jgi:hypothetical protein